MARHPQDGNQSPECDHDGRPSFHVRCVPPTSDSHWLKASVTWAPLAKRIGASAKHGGLSFGHSPPA
ncbi:hypothetical protein IG631_02718 [Alternaria alternata]|nr:hypothetical protein IG631_02718 [Alternaria alternata]